MAKFPVDAPKQRVIKVLETLGFSMVLLSEVLALNQVFHGMTLSLFMRNGNTSHKYVTINYLKTDVIEQ